MARHYPKSRLALTHRILRMVFRWPYRPLYLTSLQPTADTLPKGGLFVPRLSPGKKGQHHDPLTADEK